jgi:hypothetical protein
VTPTLKVNPGTLKPSETTTVSPGVLATPPQPTGLKVNPGALKPSETAPPIGVIAGLPPVTPPVMPPPTTTPIPTKTTDNDGGMWKGKGTSVIVVRDDGPDVDVADSDDNAEAVCHRVKRKFVTEDGDVVFRKVKVCETVETDE